MATFTSFSNALVVSQSEGWDGVIKPLRMEFQVTDGPIFKYLMNKLHFDRYRKSILDKTPDTSLTGEHDIRYAKQLELLKEDIRNGKVKIRIEFYVETKIE